MTDCVKEIEIISAQIGMRAYEDTLPSASAAYLRAQALLQQAHRSLLIETEKQIAVHAQELMPMLEGAGEELVRAASDFREMLQAGAAARQHALFEHFAAALENVAMQDAAAAAEVAGTLRRAGALRQKAISADD